MDVELVRPLVHIITDNEDDFLDSDPAHVNQKKTLRQNRPQTTSASERNSCCTSKVKTPSGCVSASQVHPPRYTENAKVRLEMTALTEAARVTRAIGSAVIKRQAASINCQLLQVQFQSNQRQCRSMPCESIQGQQEEPQYDCLPPSNKRHKFFLSTLHGCVSYDVTISPHDNESSPPEADKENQWRLQNEARHDVIWNQVDRMQRMSLYLKNAQLAQELFLRELKDYLATVGQRE